MTTTTQTDGTHTGPSASVLTDRIRGSLYGLLIGDALGCPIEGWSPGKIQRRYGVLAMMEENMGWSPRPRGLHSDDGQQAIALCDAILEDPDAPAVGFARGLVELYTDGPKDRDMFGHHRGTGRNFRTTVLKLEEGAGVYGASQPSAGNGNAMLIAPAAWYWRDDLATLSARVIDISLVKQHSTCGVGSAAAVAFVTAHGLQEGGFDGLELTDLLEFVIDIETRVHERASDRGLVRGASPDRTFSSSLRRALSLFDRKRRQALAGIAKIANETADRRVFATSGYSVASVIASLYMTLTARSLFDGILDTVNLGGDADTTGAMVGSMVGAAFGFGAVPSEWLEDLVARGAFDDRVPPMVQRARGWRPARSLVELERAWTTKLIEPFAKERPKFKPRPLGLGFGPGSKFSLDPGFDTDTAEDEDEDPPARLGGSGPFASPLADFVFDEDEDKDNDDARPSAPAKQGPRRGVKAASAKPAPGGRSARAAKPTSAEPTRAGEPERVAKPERAAKPAGAAKAEKPEAAEKPEKPEKPEAAAKPSASEAEPEPEADAQLSLFGD
ncbi:MAG: ADP-ribosylglycohydrolase family protein [Myxococcales bacterium]|nr:ADP-ribosylglycohydrolase family protein [Myxococcales bacterium]